MTTRLHLSHPLPRRRVEVRHPGRPVGLPRLPCRRLWAALRSTHLELNRFIGVGPLEGHRRSVPATDGRRGLRMSDGANRADRSAKLPDTMRMVALMEGVLVVSASRPSGRSQGVLRGESGGRQAVPGPPVLEDGVGRVSVAVVPLGADQASTGEGGRGMSIFRLPEPERLSGTHPPRAEDNQGVNWHADRIGKVSSRQCDLPVLLGWPGTWVPPNSYRSTFSPRRDLVRP